MNMSEFPPDHERFLWTGRNILLQPQSASPRHRDGARALLHAGKGEDPLGQLLHHLGLWVLLQLGVRVRGCGPGTGPAPLRHDTLVHLLSTPCPCDEFVGHVNTVHRNMRDRNHFLRACYFLAGETSDIPKISFFREGGPNREPRELVAGFFDGTLDRLLLSLPSFE